MGLRERVGNVRRNFPRHNVDSAARDADPGFFAYLETLLKTIQNRLRFARTIEMLQKKICMLGASAVGKTSLVRQFVHSMFEDKYLTTVGVKIDKKVIEVEGESLNLMLWDLEGDDEFQKLRLSYLRGASGYLLVVDGTRRQTLDVALDLKQRVEDSVGVIPFICVLNKADLKEEWTLIEERLAELVEQGWSMVETSAKTGMGVEEAFGGLAGKLIAD